MAAQAAARRVPAVPRRNHPYRVRGEQPADRSLHEDGGSPEGARMSEKDGGVDATSSLCLWSPASSAGDPF